MAPRAGLADYLRARRGLMQPEDVGLARGDNPRRVSGLRREEVAILAGISTDYYLRLEQGRDVHPSPQVLDALARALRLDPVATEYLHMLARTASPKVQVQAQAGAYGDGDVLHEGIPGLIDSWPHTAAVVHNRYFDVLASNRLARAINPNYRVGVNRLSTLMLDPSEREFHRGWEELTIRSVALLRSMADTRTDDSRLDALVAEISERSQRFRELWERNDVALVSDGIHLLTHPIVGDLVAHYVRLPLVDTGGQSLFLYFAEPASPTAAAFEVLEALAQAEGEAAEGEAAEGDQQGQEDSVLQV